ncbi:hypothetical protein BKA62DRAFT_581258, partial [Auriculariales sp. MPI-PUGE-AT-0066]
ELKPNDVFDDKSDQFVPQHIDTQLILGQMGQAFHNVMSKQNRTHLFSLLIIETGWARIIRWDRASVIVSARISYTNKSTSHLAEF